jgi:hypothetical protein
LTFFNIFDDDVDVRSACTHLALLGWSSLQEEATLQQRSGKRRRWFVW